MSPPRWQLVALTEEYVDDPEQVVRVRDKLRDALTTKIREIALQSNLTTYDWSKLLQSASIDALTQVLRTQLPGLEDSDPVWAETIVEEDWQWLVEAALDERYRWAASRPDRQATMKPEAATDVERRAKIRKRIEIFSSRSTAAPASLAQQPRFAHITKAYSDDNVDWIAKHISTYLSGSPDTQRFFRTIVSDQDLAARLVAELCLRGYPGKVRDQHVPHHIALVGEWDTTYGRTIQKTLSDAFRALLRADELDRSVHPMLYLRGLDGAIPGRDRQTGADDEANSDPQGDLASDQLARYEYPVGPSQLDYVRRLGRELKRIERDLRAQGSDLFAIGVVGSDVYDKQLILQALHELFPRAVFFTTDLDARLDHPSQYSWSRNLLVASGFGFRLSPNLDHEEQESMPSFRDNYQTSTYLACLLALRGINVQAAITQSKDPDTSAVTNGDRSPADARGDQPVDAGAQGSQSVLDASEQITKYNVDRYLDARIFEIGRAGAYDLTPQGEQNTALYPQRPNGVVWPTLEQWLMLIAITSCVLLMTLPLWPRTSEIVFGLARRRRASLLPATGEVLGRQRLALASIILITFASFLVVAWCATHDNQDGTGEPFEWFNGISIWPTQLSRLVVISLGVYLIWVMAVRLRRSDHDLARTLGLPSPRTLKSVIERPRRGVRFGAGADLSPTPGGSKSSGALVKKLWRNVSRSWKWMLRSRSWISINNWKVRHGATCSATLIWRQYCRRSRFRHRVTRILPPAAVYAVFGFLVWLTFGMPQVPYRGLTSLRTDTTLLWICVVVVLGATFLIIDATRLAERMIRHLANQKTLWPVESRQSASEKLGVAPSHQDDVDDHLDVDFIVRQTEFVGPLIVLPFALLFIMVISRNRYFDSWDWSLSLGIVFSVISLFALYRAIKLRHAAEFARRRAIARLTQRSSEYLEDVDSESKARRKRIDLMIAEIRDLKRGAFAPWTQHPIVQAVLIPFSGVGLVTLLDVLSKMG